MRTQTEQYRWDGVVGVLYEYCAMSKAYLYATQRIGRETRRDVIDRYEEAKANRERWGEWK